MEEDIYAMIRKNDLSQLLNYQLADHSQMKVPIPHSTRFELKYESKSSRVTVDPIGCSTDVQYHKQLVKNQLTCTLSACFPFNLLISLGS